MVIDGCGAQEVHVAVAFGRRPLRHLQRPRPDASLGRLTLVCHRAPILVLQTGTAYTIGPSLDYSSDVHLRGQIARHLGPSSLFAWGHDPIVSPALATESDE